MRTDLILAIAAVSSLLLASLAIIILEPDTSNGIVSDSDWAQWQSSPAHNGVVNGSATSSELKWSFDTGAAIDVTPVVVGHVAYLLDGEGEVHAVDMETGEGVWSARTDEPSTFQSSAPAYGDGQLFVATYAGYLYAFDALTGHREWKTRAVTGEDRSLECPLTYHDHRLYIGEGLSGSGAKHYLCFNDQGARVWEYAVESTSGFIWSGAAVAEDHLVVPVFEGRLISLDLETGREVDQIDLAHGSVVFARPDLGMVRSSAVWANGSAYLTSESGQSIGYIFKVGMREGMFTGQGWSAPIGFSTSTPAIHGGEVFVGNGEHGAASGNLTCLNDGDGSVLWTFPVDSGVKSSPAVAVVADGKVLVHFTVQRGQDGSVVCVDGNGTLVWEFDPQGDDAYILQGAVISEGDVLFGTDDGKIYCLGAAE